MTDVATLRIRLAEAENALHELMTTGSTSMMRHGLKEWRTRQATVDELRGYIAELKGQLRAAGEAVSGGRIRARAVYF